MSTNEAETRARTMGWLPLDKFEGPKERWVDADTYLKRGEEFLPILKANNRKLADQVNSVENELRTTKQQLAAAQEAIEGLKDFRSTLNKEKAVDEKRSITAAISKARSDGDVEAESQLIEKLGEVTAAIKEADKPKAKAASGDPAAPELTPAAKEWMAANPWFSQDQRKTGLAMGLANEWKAQGKTLGTKEFFDHVDVEMEKIFDPNAGRRERPGKVEGSTGSSEGGGGGKSFADLPAEAQAACKKTASRVVGPGRAYKTLADWQKAYCETYDWS
jgi:hypothetical protein